MWGNYPSANLGCHHVQGIAEGSPIALCRAWQVCRWSQQALLPSCKLRGLNIDVIALTNHARAVSSNQLGSRQLVLPLMPANHLLEGLQLLRLLQLLSFFLQLLLLQDLVHKLQLILVQRPVLA